MKLFGVVTFTEGSKTYAWTSRGAAPAFAESPFDVTTNGITIETAVGPALIAWDAVEDVRGWAPVSEEDR